MGKFKRALTGTLFVAAAGYVAGLLTAPKSGKETREDIRETIDRSRSETEKKLKELLRRYMQIWTNLNQKTLTQRGGAEAGPGT